MTDKDSKREEVCKGCESYEIPIGETLFCDLPYINDDGIQCPCSICLIKMICNITCEEYRIYVTKENDGRF